MSTLTSAFQAILRFAIFLRNRTLPPAALRMRRLLMQFARCVIMGDVPEVTGIDARAGSRAATCRRVWRAG